MIEIIRSARELLGDPYVRYLSLRDAWQELGGEIGEDITITQIKKVIKAEAGLIAHKAQTFNKPEEHRDEIETEKEKAKGLRRALRLEIPQDYDILIGFFSGRRDYNEQVMSGAVSDGGFTGRPKELVRRRYVQSKSAADYLEAVKVWRIRNDGNVHIKFTPKTTS